MAFVREIQGLDISECFRSSDVKPLVSPEGVMETDVVVTDTIESIM